ncbi:ATP-NAD kinase-like domain-containing protein [Pyronema domesticum]|uniref:Similar to NADH kinase POS5, mitochondrial acc. no. Q06892 n=1 Tax=Pyronema omphalodes (strain CBS 100304) TaxID=1076935 RepID=U4LB28_PYROM|nr:ATP-NAD kinase-like domain-containing protein [Pyronema domesticum]CCX16663.1 Similar to NADH kinase POS5, mitochondrial; acc. no. Q06892 [Pyronema omphalodes CBS 100304]
MRARTLPRLSRRRYFSSSASRQEVLSINVLPDRVHPLYAKLNDGSHLLSLSWKEPPRNFMIVKKPGVDSVGDAMVEFINHITATYPATNIILEPTVAQNYHHRVSCPIYTIPPASKSSPFPFTQSTYPRTPHHYLHPPRRVPVPKPADIQKQAHPATHSVLTPQTNPYHQKTDALITLGGDGTILHAASLFSSSRAVPPILSFAMGTLGFLGEFKWSEHQSAFKSLRSATDSCIRILRRNRLKAGVFGKNGERIGGEWGEYEGIEDAHAMNELSLHRGRDPHLTILEIFIGGHFLTEAVADGIIVSTPTGSTAYSLSSGGSIIHPSVPSLSLTPICPRSLSFRPLVLPEDAKITLRLSEKNRGREVEVSVDGRRWGGLGPGQEVRVWLEEINGDKGGIPCVKRLSAPEAEDGWVGGLNGLLKFNHPFGQEE